MSIINYQELFEKHNCKYIPKDIVDSMIKDRNVRIAICKNKFTLFFHFYFAHYVHYKTAPFQHELFLLAEDNAVKNLFVVAFRGSGKSTILTTAYPIWAILGSPSKKFVLILCQTRSQAKQHMMNLKRELESNQLLKDDLGPFQEESDEWGSASLVFSKLNSRITAASTEQSIRGLRHNQYRPDLIIADDVEDIASTKTRESRQKTYQWLTGEVIPSGDRSTRLVVVGNLLHEDSLLMRLKQDVEEKRIEGVFKSYPLLDQAGTIAWLGKYPDTETIESEKRKIGNDIAWHREYLLHIISDAGRAVHPEWIQYYDGIPYNNHHLAWISMGIDLAISEKDTADYTAMVAMKVYHINDQYTAFVLPNPLNKRLTFPEQLKYIKSIATNFCDEKTPEIYIENVGYQEALLQQLRSDGLYATGVPARGDKRQRIMMTTAAIQSGRILFPRKGAENLILQLIGFGVEKHDDLADAFAIVANQFVIDSNKPTPGFYWL